MVYTNFIITISELNKKNNKLHSSNCNKLKKEFDKCLKNNNNKSTECQQFKFNYETCLTKSDILYYMK